MASGKKNTVGIVTDLVRPITDELGLFLILLRKDGKNPLYKRKSGKSHSFIIHPIPLLLYHFRGHHATLFSCFYRLFVKNINFFLISVYFFGESLFKKSARRTDRRYDLAKLFKLHLLRSPPFHNRSHRQPRYHTRFFHQLFHKLGRRGDFLYP